MVPFLWIGFNCLKARRHFTFYHSVPRNSRYSFYRPRKNERLSRPWSHSVVLNTGLLDWECSALTTRPLLHKSFLLVLFVSIFSPNCDRFLNCTHKNTVSTFGIKIYRDRTIIEYLIKF